MGNALCCTVTSRQQWVCPALASSHPSRHPSYVAVLGREDEISDSQGVSAHGLWRRLAVGFRNGDGVPGCNKCDGIFVFNAQFVGLFLLTLMTLLRAELPIKIIIRHPSAFNCRQISVDSAWRQGLRLISPKDYSKIR